MLKIHSLHIKKLKHTNEPLSDCRYVGGVVSYYYHSDDDVIKDSELQSWINEIIVFGHLGDEKRGLSVVFL